MGDSDIATLRRDLDSASASICRLKQQMIEQGKQLAEKDKQLAEQDKQLAEQGKQLAEKDRLIKQLQAKVALYESPNMPTSRPSLYNDKRKKFRERRGENPGGSPGDGSVGKKRGPPEGHKGVSHCNTPSVRLEFNLDSMTCQCGGSLMLQKPISKTIIDLDGNMSVKAANAMIQRAVCEKCGDATAARTPFLEGTSLGPVSISIITVLFDAGCTDERIAHLLHSIFGMKVATNTVRAARHAAAAALEGMIRRIKAMILLMLWIHIDETMFKRGDGHWGYVWVVYCSEAVFVHFSPTRSAAVLDMHMGWLRDKVAGCDGYIVYRGFFKDIQRCWRHLLAYAEEPAVSRGGSYEDVYDKLLSFYCRIRDMKTLSPLAVMELSREVYGIASLYGKGKVATLLKNAIPHMFTFLSYPGMPPHNNDAEREIRDGIIPQRNVRHKIVTAEGRDTFSKLVTFCRTCHRQKISACRAMLEYLLDRDWDMFNRSEDMPFSLVNRDGTRYSVFDMPGPPARQKAAPRHQAAVVPAITA